MIAAAADERRQHPLLLGLKIAWFLAAAVALPLLELFRNGSHLPLAGLLGYGAFLTLLVTVQAAVLILGPRTLGYSLRHEILYLQSAIRTLAVPLERVERIRLLDGTELRYRSGISLPNYHVGRFAGPGGSVQVIASRLDGTGLLITFRRPLVVAAPRRQVFFSPAEPEVIRELLYDILREQRERRARGQP